MLLLGGFMEHPLTQHANSQETDLSGKMSFNKLFHWPNKDRRSISVSKISLH